MRAVTLSSRALRNAPALARTSARPQCLLNPKRCSQSPRHLSSSPRTCRPSTETKSRHTVDPITLHRLAAERQAHYKRRSYYAAAGFLFGMVGIYLTATSIELPPPAKMDSGDARKSDPLVALGKERKVVVQKLGEEPEENVDVVPTGTNKVPVFPRLLEFVDTDAENGVGATPGGGVEYQLVGLGVRTVSFLSIEVYVVGMYIATDDIASLQEALIRKVDPVATTLVPDEKAKLRSWLLEADKGEEMWSDVLKKSGARTIIRIVPTRDTDFAHMRDAWVRTLGARSKKDPSYADESFGQVVADFKGLFKKGKGVPKGKEMILSRDHDGALAIWYDDGKVGPVRLGGIKDERVSRSLWLGYLGGKTVASEPARQNIVDGIMEFVERPVGTVATQVV